MSVSALSDVEDKDNAEMARLIIEECLLGRIHTLMLTAKRFAGLGFSGISRELEGLEGKGRK